MSDREKLIEILSVPIYPHLDADPVEVVADYLIDNGVTLQKWIPVSERLPDGECLAVSMLNGPAYQEMLIGYVGEASNWDTGYECESYGEILPNVTHWMPLPSTEGLKND